MPAMSRTGLVAFLLVAYICVLEVSGQSEAECIVSRPPSVLTFSPWPTPLPPRTPTSQLHSLAPMTTITDREKPSLPPVGRPLMTPTINPKEGSHPSMIPVNPPSVNASTVAPTTTDCVHDARAVQYHRSDDVFAYQPDRIPIEITSQSGSNVSFTVHQAWKKGDPMSWVAIEYKNPVSGWTCSKSEHAPYGPTSSFSAACDADGWTQVRLYAHDDTFQDTSDVHPVPSYCSPSPDGSKTLAFFYKVPCVSECYPIPSDCAVETELYDYVGSQAFNSSPIEVIIKNSTSVTFRVLQTWVTQPICTMATYYPSVSNGVACDRIDAVKPGGGGKYTAMCKGGTALVIVYLHDTTFDPLVNKAKIPSLCNVDARDREASYSFLIPCDTPSDECILPSNISCRSGVDHVAVFEDFESGQASSWTFGVEAHSRVHGRLLGPLTRKLPEVFKVFIVPTVPSLFLLEFNILQSGGWASGDKIYVRIRSQYMELLSFLGILQSKSGTFGDIKVTIESRALKTTNSSVTDIFKPVTFYHVQVKIPQRWYADGHLMVGFKVDPSVGNTTDSRAAAFDDVKITAVCDPANF